MKTTWIKIVLTAKDIHTNEALEEFASLIAASLNKAVLEHWPEIDIYIPYEEYEHVLAILSALRHRVPFSMTIAPFEDKSWETEWKKYLKPIKIGHRIIVKPSWENNINSYGYSIIISLDPGMAFGTGHHETTKLCLEWLDRFSNTLQPEEHSLLDVGTGSGILAIAAAKLGFAPVVGVDIDQDALDVAKNNALLNNVAPLITFVHGESTILSETFDVIIANIQADTLISMKYDLRRRLKPAPSSKLVLSGILNHQREAVKNGFEDIGFKLNDFYGMNEWILLVFSDGRDDWI